MFSGISEKKLYILLGGIATTVIFTAMILIHLQTGDSFSIQKTTVTSGLSLDVSQLDESRIEVKITNNENQILSNIYLYVDGILKTGGPVASPLAGGHTTSIDFEVSEGDHRLFANSTEGFESEVVEYP